MHSTDTFTEALRLTELHSAISYFRPGCTLLEIGAGTGWQARELARMGFQVEAVDVSDGTYTAERIWPVRDYDGRNLPYSDATFDTIFSSNVLEHIEAVHEHLVEQLRVLKRGGTMIHLVPTPTWRFWTSLTYYPTAISRRFHRWRASGSAGPHLECREVVARNRRGLGALWAPAHGVDDSAIVELWRFSSARWLAEFSRLPVEEVEYSSAGVFYSGYLLFGRRMSVEMRRRLAGLLGSSCHIFRMRKP